MKKVCLFLLIFCCCLTAAAIDKSEFDLEAPGLGKTSSGWPLVSFDYLGWDNDQATMTLIDGSYFTLGTTGGISSSMADDRCAIAYGHPYAKTSYPIFSVDGTWYKAEDSFPSQADISLEKIGDTLRFSAVDSQSVAFNFTLVYQSESQSFELAGAISNLDTIPHSLGLGLVFDPALGQWGDGALLLDQQWIENDTLILSPDASTPISIWEKSAGAKGIGIDLDFPETMPERIIAANWADIYASPAPEFENSLLRTIYDLTLKIYWPEEEIMPGATKTAVTILQLKEPDFSTGLLLRWDAPTAFSLTNNRLFPRDFKTFIEIFNETGSGITDASLQLTLPDAIQSSDTNITVAIPADEIAFAQADLKSKVMYEDYILPLIVELRKDGKLFDEMRRNIFLPGVPMSDTGLVITLDSINTESYPEVSFIFTVEDKDTKYRIRDLSSENLTVSENELPITDFEFGKQTTGGATLVDIVFVLDCSGSMGDDIDSVRTNLNEFAETLARNGYDFQIGVVTFSTTIDDVWDFTNDIEQIKANLASIQLWGGIEDSPAALYRATQLSWRPGSKRTIIWITDEPYPEHNYTKEQVVNRMLSMDITIYGIGQLKHQTEWMNPIVYPTGGSFYDITGKYRDILLDITNLFAVEKYVLNFTSSSTSADSNLLCVEIHFEGRGAIQTFAYQPPSAGSGLRILTFYPNPFNQEITFRIDSDRYRQGDIMIYNVLGQLVRKFSLTPNAYTHFVWKTSNEQGLPIGSGLYIVKLSMRDETGKIHAESAKILYLK